MKRLPLFLCLFLLFLLVAAGIPPAAASPSLSYVTPSSWPNTGVATLTLVGSGFNANSTVWMTPASVCDPTNKIYGSIRSWSANTMTATFSLSGKTPGTYRIWVNSPFTDSRGNHDDEAPLATVFEIYKGTGTSYTTSATTAATGVTTTVTTAVTSGEGENSVFFETNPSGAEIWLNGVDIGTGTFTYYTNRDGTYDVVVKKTGYEDYKASVTIIRGQRVHFYAPLTMLASGSTAVATPASGTPAKTVTTIQKSKLKIPTPLGTDPPVAEEAPADPAIALGAAGIAIGLVLLRRR